MFPKPPYYNPPSPDLTRPLTLQRVRLNSGGYDSFGSYYGVGAPLWWTFSADGSLDIIFRSASRETAKAEIRAQYPGARFFR